MKKPAPHVGLRHIALNVRNISACRHFYVDLLGLKIVWEPDGKNLYLSSGTDNLALHQAPPDFVDSPHQHLDHLGFFLQTPEAVDEWYAYLREEGAIIKAGPKNHRDGTRSFYCEDPEGNVVQMIYYPIPDPATSAG